MLMWPQLRSIDPQLDPARTKIHLAVHNGKDDPLELFRSGEFPTWQTWQSRCNFEREFVLALIETREPHLWLFAGTYSKLGRRPEGDGHRYDLIERPDTGALVGRMILRFERPGRQSYLNAESWEKVMHVVEIRRDRLSTPPFPGVQGHSHHESPARSDRSRERSILAVCTFQRCWRLSHFRLEIRPLLCGLRLRQRRNLGSMDVLFDNLSRWKSGFEETSGRRSGKTIRFPAVLRA